MKTAAYAKLNLILNVKGKRPDGFHELESLMQSISLCDMVNVEAQNGDSVWLNASGLPMSCNPQNLAIRAAKAVKEEFGIKSHIVIDIEKNIPVAGGLGGGSADCAAVIFCMAKIFNLDDEKRLFKIAEGLGSDVPFCLASQFGKTCAIARGKGEGLEFVSGKQLNIELKTLDIHIKNKTAKVYQALLPDDYANAFDIAAFLEAGSFEEQEVLLGNHLENAARRVFDFEGAAANTLPASCWHLCGAGPTLFRLSKEETGIKTLSCLP